MLGKADAPADEVIGVLGKEVGVRLLNGSPSGCLVETNSHLDVGTIATLRIKVNGTEFVDDVRVIRCQQIEGAGSLFQVGAQFLWTALPHSRSLRQVLSRVTLAKNST